jgi:phosphoadenosine phosphosulfate reductase
MTDIEIAELNEAYKMLNPIHRLDRLFQDFDPNDILVTSSFGTTSGILMSMVSKVAPGHPIHFIDTTFCFQKTIAYKNTLTEILGLNIIDVLPDIDENTQTRKESLWKTDTNACCYINKVKPFEAYIKMKKIWISGLLMNQTPFRANLEIFEKRKDIIKMHPNIDTSPMQFDMYLIDNGIPPHPLKLEGYDSVGCTHCTSKGEGREGRWAGEAKTECGIHL